MRAVTIEGRQAGVEHGGHGRRLEPLGGYAAAGREELPGGQGGRGPLAGHDLDRSGLRVVDHDRDLAAEADRGGVGDGQGEDRGDRRVRGVAAALEDLDARPSTAPAPPATTAPFVTRGLPVSGVPWGRLGQRDGGDEDTDRDEYRGISLATMAKAGSLRDVMDRSGEGCPGGAPAPAYGRGNVLFHRGTTVLSRHSAGFYRRTSGSDPETGLTL